MPRGKRVERVTLDDAVLREIESARLAGELDSTYVEPRCHVCCETESRDFVNTLLANGATNRQIAEFCEVINNRRREAGDDREINARNVWHHRREHFNIEEPAMAIYREVMERRAEEAGKDHINGIGHAITPLAVMETVLVKGYARTMKEETEVSVKEMVDTAKALHEITARDAGTKKMADLVYKMDRIIQAAQEFVPPEQHEAFLARVEGRDTPIAPMQVLTERVHETARQAVRDFTPAETIDEGDEF